MIKLDVKDYCHTCKDFEVEVDDKRAVFYSDTSSFIGEVSMYGDLTIKCAHQAKCDRIREYLKEKILKENK